MTTIKAEAMTKNEAMPKTMVSTDKIAAPPWRQRATPGHSSGQALHGPGIIPAWRNWLDEYSPAAGPARAGWWNLPAILTICAKLHKLSWQAADLREKCRLLVLLKPPLSAALVRLRQAFAARKAVTAVCYNQAVGSSRDGSPCVLSATKYLLWSVSS